MIFVYTLICPVESVVKYIGITKDPEGRLSQHCGDVFHKEKNKWVRFLKKKKLKPVMKIIDMVPEKDKLTWEQHYVQLYKNNGAELLNKITNPKKIVIKRNNSTIKKEKEIKIKKKIKYPKEYFKSIIAQNRLFKEIT